MSFRALKVIPRGLVTPSYIRGSTFNIRLFYSSFKNAKYHDFIVKHYSKSIYNLKFREFSQLSANQSAKAIQDEPKNINNSEKSTNTADEETLKTESTTTKTSNSNQESNLGKPELNKHANNFSKAAALAKKSAQAHRDDSRSQNAYLSPFGRFKFLALIGTAMIGTGYIYSYCIEKKLTFKEFLKLVMKFCDDKQTAFSDFLSDMMDKYFPLSSEPLLPDTAELNIPENMPTLVIDFDKVIAHLEHDRRNGWQVVKRPGADRFFKELFNYYEIVVWSDDMFPIANDVVGKWGLPVMGCLHRDQCMKRRGHYVKDLSRLGRKLERTIIVDHDPFSYMLQPENGILVREFTGDPDDRELDSLVDLLKSISYSNDDVRTALKRYEGSGTDIGYKFMIEKAEEDKKAESRRTVGKAFGFGSVPRSGFGAAPVSPTPSPLLR